MIILDTTTKKLQVLMGGAASTTNPDYVVSYADITTTAFTPGNSNGTLNGSTAVDVVAAPAASTYRQIKTLSILNVDTSTQTITVRYNDNGTSRKIIAFSILTNYSLNYDETTGWYVLDASGNRLTVTGSPNITGSTGIVAQTASTTYAARTVTGTSNQITVTNGDGVSGNPTLALSSTVDLTGKTVNVQDSTFSIKDDGDATKIAQFQCSGITTGTTRTLTVPNASGTLMLAGNNLSDLSSAATSRTNLGVDGTFNNIVRQVFTSSGTYTPTSNMVYCDIEVVGAGGGGGGCAASVIGLGAGAGGGGGGYARGRFTAATIGASKTVTIGAAGTGGTAGANAGVTGGTSSVGILITATGGTGGQGGSANTGTAPFTIGGPAAGAGTLGDYQTTGMPAIMAFWTSSTGIAGAGGNSFFGGGALGNGAGGGAGPAAQSYGGGGGGAIGTPNVNTTYAGGVGFKGLVIVTEYIKVN